MTETGHEMDKSAGTRSLYQVLGCSNDASSTDLKKAYRKLALQLHPDKNLGDQLAASRFQEVSRAYDVLGDPQKRIFYDKNGLTEELDVSAEDWMSSFTEMVHEFTGGMPIKEMFNGLSKRELSSMPPFPFPKELFPADTFPNGVHFSEDSMDMLPPSVRELVEAGQASSLGLMFQNSSEQLGPEASSLLSLLMGSTSQFSMPGDQQQWKSHNMQGHASSTLPVGMEFDSSMGDLGFLDECSDEELMKKLMCGEVDLGGLGLSGMVNALKCFGTQASDDLTSNSSSSMFEQMQSDPCTSEAGDEDAAVPRKACDVAGSCEEVLQASIPAEQNEPTMLLQEIGDGLTSDFEAGIMEGSHVGEDHRGPIRGSTDSCSNQGSSHCAGTESPRNPSECHNHSELSRGLRGAGVGHTGLHWAAAGGHVDAVQWFVEAGLCPNSLNAVGSTAMHTVAAHGHSNVLRLLLDQPGCRPEIVNEDGESALQVADRRGHPDCVVLLRHKSTAQQPAIDTFDISKSCPFESIQPANNIHATRCGHEAGTHSALAGLQQPPSSCISVDATQEKVQTSLEEKSVNASEKPSSRSTQNSAVMTSGVPSCVRESDGPEKGLCELLQAAAWPQIVPKDEGNAWMQAAKTGGVTVLQTMLESNVALIVYRGQGTSFGFGGNSALHWAVAKGHSATARMLLSEGADPNCGNNAGRTPLHSAVCNKQLAMVKLLILEGAADPQARDLDGDTPRDAALSVFGADHDAVVAIDCCSLACKLRTCACDGVRWQVRDMKALLVNTGVAVVPGCERGDLERQCQDCLSALPHRISARNRTAQIARALDQSTQDVHQLEKLAAGACATAGSCHAQPLHDSCNADGEVCNSGNDAMGSVPVHAAAAKKNGNAAFSAGDFKKAIVQYTMALRVTRTSPEDPTSSESVSLFRAALFSNRSAAHASSSLWQEALHDAQEALKIDDQCAKYWCRKGAAQLGCGRLQDALCSYKQALEVDGSSAVAQAGLELVRSQLLDS